MKDNFVLGRYTAPDPAAGEEQAALLAQRIEHEPSKLGVEGSNPSERATVERVARAIGGGWFDGDPEAVVSNYPGQTEKYREMYRAQARAAIGACWLVESEEIKACHQRIDELEKSVQGTTAVASAAVRSPETEVALALDDAEFLEEIRRSDERRARFKELLAKSLKDPDNKFDFDGHPFPWTAQMVIWDGPGVQFMDARDKPVLCDLLRDPDDAATLLDLCNTMGLRTQVGDNLTGASASEPGNCPPTPPQSDEVKGCWTQK